MGKRPLCLTAVILLCIQAILTCGFQIAEDLKPSSVEENIDAGADVMLRGTVSGREENAEYQTIYLTDVQVCHNEQILNESKILVYIEQNNSEEQNIKKIAVGNEILVEGEVSFFNSATNPGNFDQKIYYQKQQIHACVWAKEFHVTDSETSIIKEKLTAFRMQWKELLVGEMGAFYGNSMSAILLGDKKGLDLELKELYQKSGIGHILAISGLHMSFIGIGFYNLLRKAGVGFLPAGIVGITFLSLYTIMIGGGVSSIRALLMFLIRIGADVTGRVYDLPTSLSVAASVIVMWQPLYLMDAGFLLSFGAILGIAVVEPVLQTFHIFPKFLCGGMAIQLVTFPIVLYFYFEIPLYSQILNLLIIPLMSVVLGAGISGSLVYVLWMSAGKQILKICSAILWIYEKSCLISMELPFSRIIVGQPPIWLIIVYYLILFGSMYRMWSLKKKKERDEEKKSEIFSAGRLLKNVCSGVAMILFMVLFCLMVVQSHGSNDELKVTMLDVGQGDGIYIKTPSGMNLLVDGGSSDISEVGKYRIEPYLESQGVLELDYVFLSHGDTDHTSGIEEMLTNQKLGIKIQTLVLPTENVIDETLLAIAQLASQYGTRVVTMKVGEFIADGEMKLTCVAPSVLYDGEIGNASSMVLDLQYGEFDMLFTGDLEKEGEEAIVENGILRDYDVLKVGHHGSKNSSSEAFLEQVKPEIALISAGRENQYGHPSEETLKRLENIECEVYSTQECGAITLVTDGKQISVRKYQM